jgi:AraC-like DNA-binding protein
LVLGALVVDSWTLLSRLPVRQATSAADFLDAPLGACLQARRWTYFHPHEDFSGYMVWDRPDPSDFDTLAQVLATSHAPEAKPHPMLIDVREMEAFAADTFERAIRYTRANFASLRRAVTRLAVVRPDTVVGAVAAGFFNVVPAFTRVGLFSEPAAAFAWLGREADASVLDEVKALRTTGLGSPLLRDLQHLLDAEPSLAVAEAARRLGLSVRTLQRRLGELGTNLTHESSQARVRLAERLLAESDLSVTEIAFRVGCSSAQHFSTLFRAFRGEPPSAYRARRHGPPNDDGAF